MNTHWPSRLSACICTHNPNPAIFSRCLGRIAEQRPTECPVELLIIDNASTPPITEAQLGRAFPFPVRIVREDPLGLGHARMAALRESRGDVLIFIDDDNLLAPDYFAQVERSFRARPRAGAIGGRSIPLPEVPIPGWCDEEMLSYLACIDRGGSPLLLNDWRTPIGAGMAIRKEAFATAASVPFVLGDRKGGLLSSGGDSELCYRIRGQGWELWYEPDLSLEHVLPARRLTVEYLSRLNEAFGRDRPYLEFYWYPGTWRRRFSYVVRAVEDLLEARRLAGAAPGTEASRDVHQSLRLAFVRGRSRSLLRLAFGPNVWEQVRAIAWGK